MATEDEIKKQFPNLYNLYHNIPEIWAILLWATTSQMGPEQVQAAIQTSNYYKSRNEAQRKWDATLALDPSQANRLLEQSRTATVDNAVRLGLKLDQHQVDFFAVSAASLGWSAQELNDAMVMEAWHGPTSGTRGPGEFGAAMTQVRQIANEYAMPITDAQAAAEAKNLLIGSTGEKAATTDSLRDTYAQRAMSLYPSLKAELQAGVTVAQWAAPYKQVAASELGVAPDAMTFNDPKWKAMLEGSKAKDGTFTPLTLSQWQTTVRTDPSYGYDKTSNGRLVAAGLADQIGKMFGNAQ